MAQRIREKRKGRAPQASRQEAEGVEARPLLAGLKPWHTGTLLASLAIVAFAWLAWTCTRNPGINFLPRHADAEWILFPKSPAIAAHGVGSLETVFRRSFELTETVRAVRLELRAARRAEVTINGRPLEIAPAGNWKDPAGTEVASFLQTGTNIIEARVFNEDAPPALWLILTSDRLHLRSDGAWEASCAGSAWRRVALASALKLPGPGNPMGEGERTLAAVRRIWPMWLVMAGLAMMGALAWHRGLGHRALSVVGEGSRRQTALLLLSIGAVWLVLFVNNAVHAPFSQGFDSQEHLDYIKYVQTRRAVPLPNEGFEMFQPPLYYAVSAVLLSVCGATVDSPSGVLVLRFLTMSVGVLHFALVLLCLRLVLPGRRAPQLVGLALAAFLPMQLYLSHNVTNETLGALLITASLYLGLRLLRSHEPSLAQFAWLGLSLGAALLAKATALLLIPPLAVALIVKTADRRAPVSAWTRGFAVLAAVFLAVSGWHYARIWRAFGHPFLGNWEAASGFSWWQDPGFHTAVDYARFGRSFVSPLFSGLWSFADGIYSTLWGDALCGGAPLFALRPPWNYNAMIGGYFLALAPSLLIVAGAATALWRLVRKPSTDAILLIGLAGAVAFGLVFMTLRVPSYAQVKAFYGLAMLVPLCYFAALGWEALTRGRRVVEAVMGSVLLIWVMNSIAAFWIVPSVPQHIYAGLREISGGKARAAEAEAMKAVQSAPSDATAHRFLAAVSSDAGRAEDALSHARQAVALSPADGGCHLQLAMILARQGQIEAAIPEVRRSLELEPENASAYSLLQACLAQVGRRDDAIEAARDGLAVDPLQADLHQALGVSLAQKEDMAGAARHFAYAIRLRPDLEQARVNFRVALSLIARGSGGSKALREVERGLPDAIVLDEIAWFYATQPDAALRNGTEAVRLAERASALSEPKSARILATLAAAHAENGEVARAGEIAEEARLRARSAGDAGTERLTEEMLAAFRAGHAFRADPGRK